MRRLLIVAAILAAAAPVSASPYKEIRDTSVSCTNGMTCELSLKGMDDNNELYSVALSRAPGPDTPVRLIIRTSSPLAAGSTVRFEADGKDVLSISADGFDLFPDDNEYTAKDAMAGRMLFAAVKDASNLAVSFNAEKPGESRFSLAGVAGAGLFMDEAQGRLEAKDALVRIGGKDTAPSAVRDIVDFDQLPPSIQPDFANPESDCGFVEELRFRYGQGFAVKISDDTELYVLPCALGGAYNQPYALYQVYDGKASEVVLPAMSDDGPTTTSGAVNVDWDQTTRTLTAFDKGRGLGDCGTYDKWVLRDDPADVSFALVESRFKDDCDGEGEGPETWPLLWPKK